MTDEGLSGRRSEHWLGVLFTLLAVFAWTGSAFLMSTMFADKTYFKPFLVTYLTCGFSTLLLAPTCISYYRKHGARLPRSTSQAYQSLAGSDHDPIGIPLATLAHTAMIMCFSWTFGNYLNAASFSLTSVASSTIMTSTCSFHVLVMSALFGIERVTKRKFTGVLISILGIAAISILDALGASDTARGDFPRKSRSEMALGDIMAFISAVIAAANTILIKRRIPEASPNNMARFFGLVGFFNLVALWPAFPLLHFSGIETFILPSRARVWLVLVANSLVCLLGNYAWAYAVVLTSPTVVTVGLTLSIPLSLIGQSILHAQFAGVAYWLGAAVVVCGFLLVEAEAPHGAVLDPDPQAPDSHSDSHSDSDSESDREPPAPLAVASGGPEDAP